MDAQLRRIVNTLDERGVLDDTFVVITSDHGEGFGEYSDIRSTRVAEHGVAIDDAITHVPLLVKYPGQTESETVTEPATLTRFPEATRAVVEDEAGPEIFVPEGPVVVSAVGLNGALKTRAADYIDDLKPFTATARAVVTLEDGRIFKDITWRNQSRRMEVIDSQTSYTVGAPPKSVRSKIKESFDDMENLDVRTKGSGVEGASDATRKRLKDLGYI
jgi:arylsulfatase